MGLTECGCMAKTGGEGDHVKESMRGLNIQGLGGCFFKTLPTQGKLGWMCPESACTGQGPAFRYVLCLRKADFRMRKVGFRTGQFVFRQRFQAPRSRRRKSGRYVF